MYLVTRYSACWQDNRTASRRAFGVGLFLFFNEQLLVPEFMLSNLPGRVRSADLDFNASEAAVTLTVAAGTGPPSEPNHRVGGCPEMNAGCPRA